MRREARQQAAGQRTLTRRALIVGGLQAGTMAVLAFRMRQMQIDEAERYRLLADENRINLRLIPPVRGQIFDREGRILAQNEPTYRIVLVREDAGDVDEVLQRLHRILPFAPGEMEKVRALIARTAPFLPVTVRERVSWAEMSRVAVNAPALPGVSPEVGLSRLYPRREDLAHVVGYVGPVGPRELARYEDPPPLLRIPRFLVGKVGVEAEREEVLRGEPGFRRVEVNAVGRVVRELDRTEGRPGADLQLTIDADLQAYAQARLGEESASVVVMDCRSGDLLAVASSPSFDPNLFVRGISVADYAALRDDERRPLASKTVQDAYPPGSTFKMLVALAALEAGLVSPDETIYCPGFLEVSGRRFHCWKRGGHGNMGLEASLRESCDVYYYTLALRVGIEKITQMARRFGLGQRHGVPMSAETSGLTPDKAWKLRMRGEEWVIGDSVNAAIGQGYVLATPLQLAVMTARLATGRKVAPRLIRSIDGVETASGAGEAMDVNRNHLLWVRRGMDAVVNSRRGTAFRSRIVAADMRMAGKTGTSQVRNISAAERAEGVTRNEDLPWRRRDHALFVDFAPVENPRIAVSVVVEHGGGGSRAAAPVARDVTLQALHGGFPPLSAYPRADRERIRSEQERIRARLASRAEARGERRA